jgi:hypothetical protein
MVEKKVTSIYTYIKGRREKVYQEKIIENKKKKYEAKKIVEIEEAES